MVFLAVSGAEPGVFDEVRLLFEQGGFFMVLLGLASLVGGVAILFKFLTLSSARIVPQPLVDKVNKIGSRDAHDGLATLSREVENDHSTLGRLVRETIHRRGKPISEINEAVQSLARAEIMRLHAGMTMIDVVISVAPLLGLLGTASGLVIVFAGLDGNADWAVITKGIGRALKTTIVGMAIAVPSIIAQGFFQRKIDTYSVLLEVLLTKLAHACERDRVPAVEPESRRPEKAGV